MAKPGKKRSLSIAGHRTSISVEEPFWQALTGFAEEDGRSVAELVSEIDRQRSADNDAKPAGDVSLSAAVRLYVLGRLQAKRS